MVAVSIFLKPFVSAIHGSGLGRAGQARGWISHWHIDCSIIQNSSGVQAFSSSFDPVLDHRKSEGPFLRDLEIYLYHGLASYLISWTSCSILFERRRVFSFLTFCARISALTYCTLYWSDRNISLQSVHLASELYLVWWPLWIMRRDGEAIAYEVAQRLFWM